MEDNRKNILSAASAPTKDRCVIWSAETGEYWLTGWGNTVSHGYCGKHDQWWEGKCKACWAQGLIDENFARKS